MGTRRSIHQHAGLSAASLAAVAAMAAQGCLERWDSEPEAGNACAACHGSAERAASSDSQAAPPRDLAGNVDPSRPGVGAHQHHLMASPTHAAVACAECHLVPSATESPGHADTPLPAELRFGELARRGGREPRYDPALRSCVDTYCHGTAAPRWTSPRDPAAACGSCHGLPPAPPHVQFGECHRCHEGVIDASMTFVDPSRHIDGVVAAEVTCHSCHGSEETSAPPPDLSGSTEVSSIGVGAHETHLTDSARSLAVPCESCHLVPASADAAGHLDDGLGAELVFSGVAIANGRQPTWDRETRRCSQSWCHGPSSAQAPPTPPWTSTEGPLSCSGCHGYPPAEPHAQVSACGTCHPAVADANGKIIDRALHVDGIVQVDLPGG